MKWKDVEKELLNDLPKWRKFLYNVTLPFYKLWWKIKK